MGREYTVQFKFQRAWLSEMVTLLKFANVSDVPQNKGLFRRRPGCRASEGNGSERRFSQKWEKSSCSLLRTGTAVSCGARCSGRVLSQVSHGCCGCFAFQVQSSVRAHPGGERPGGERAGACGGLAPLQRRDPALTSTRALF